MNVYKLMADLLFLAPFQNPDQAHLFDSIYWEQYKKAMALSGVVAPIHLPPEALPTTTAINIGGDVQANVAPELPPLSEGEPIKEEAMEVDEPKAGGDIDMRSAESADTATKRDSGEEGPSTEQQQQKPKEGLPEPENEESRCSNSSTDDMWRPW